MASRQISLGVHAILVLHKVSYRPSPNPRAGGSNHNHLRGVALAQHNIYYRTLLRKVFLGGSQESWLPQAFLHAQGSRQSEAALHSRVGLFGCDLLFRGSGGFGCISWHLVEVSFQICLWHGPSALGSRRAPRHCRARPAARHGTSRSRVRVPPHGFEESLDPLLRNAATPLAGLGRNGSCQRRALWVLCQRKS